MATNIVTASFGASKLVRTRALHQWDYGQVLMFAGLDLPDAYTVHFSNQGIQGTAKTMVGSADGVDIPDEYLTTGQTVYAWVYLHAGDADGETVYSVIIPVTQRPQPTEEPPTPVQQGLIDQAIAALNAGVEAAEEAAESVQDMTVEADTLAPGSEATVEKTVDPDGAVTLTFGIPQGGHGNDGVSPTVDVTEITEGHRVSITDAEGTKTFDVLNGEPGEDGFSPIASVEQTATGATVTVTDKTGTTTANLTNGEDGTPGRGVPAGGTAGQVLSKVDGVDYNTAWTDKNPVITVTGSTPAITALPGIRYVCGEVATLDITLPASGCIDVVFESGATATVLTITPPTGGTVKWANGFDPTALEADTTYEINIADGLGVAAAWT